MSDQDGRLLELLGDVMGMLDLDELLPGVLRALLAAVPSKWASLNDVGPGGVTALVEPHLDEIWFGKFAPLAHQNPLYQYWQRTRDGRPVRFCDVCTREELESTELFQEVYRPLGINYQVALALPNQPDRILAIVLHREDQEFSDEERDFLDRARPYLIQAYRNALEYSELGREATDGLERALVDHGLTRREAEVLRLVALGRSNRDAARRLGVSDRTVQKHLERCFRKLGVDSRSQAAARAWELTGS